MSSLKTLEEEWRHIASDLSLEVVIPFEVVLPSGSRIHARVLLKDFGAPHGMLLVPSESNVLRLSDELVEQGYGFCEMDDPSPRYSYERDVIIHVLSDWGWSGPADQRPEWLPEWVDDEDS